MEGNEIDNIPFETQGRNIIAQTFDKDPATGFIIANDNRLMGPGFLTDSGLIAENAFTPILKLQLVQELRKYWPNVTKACREIGISRTTYRNHYLQDNLFANLVDEIAEGTTDHIEAFQSKLAGTNAFAFMDRAMALRAGRPEKFDKARTVILESKQGRIDESTARARMVKLKNVIDAEVVSDGIRESEDRRNAK